MLFILIGGLILVLLIMRARKGKGHLKFGQAELLIDFENSLEWEKGRARAEMERWQAAI
jgi:hypothetical protein